MRKRRRLTCGADGDDARNARSNLCFDQLFESRNVNTTITKWRYKRSERAAKHFF